MRWLVVVVVAAGCGPTFDKAARECEACVSSRECSSGLTCLDQVCTAVDAGPDHPDIECVDGGPTLAQ